MPELMLKLRGQEREIGLMDATLLGKLFGTESLWQGPCTVLLDAEAGIQTLGADSIGPSATKSYAPRLVSGRIQADSVCWLPDGKALLTVQQQKVRQGNGEEVTKQTLLVMDPAHVVAIEFLDANPLTTLGVARPALRSGSHSGLYPRPAYNTAKS
jgi:hypothetical protein